MFCEYRDVRYLHTRTYREQDRPIMWDDRRPLTSYRSQAGAVCQCLRPNIQSRRTWDLGGVVASG
jgi:hypothetical protein